MIYVFLAIAGLFALAIIANRLSKRRLCAICVSVALAWAGLVAASKLGAYDNPVLIALLAGQSITGVLYLLYKRVPAALRIFTLPFVLTLTAAGYWLIVEQLALGVFALLAMLWVAAVRRMPELSKETILLDPTVRVSAKYLTLSLPSSMHRGSKPGHTYVLVDAKGIIRYTYDDESMGIHNDRLITELAKI